MFYTSCPDICPALLDQMRRVDEAARKASVEAQIVLVSLDPKHDDPKRLAAFRSHLGSDARWHLLAGDEGSTRALANLLGVRFGTDPKTGEISHDGKIVFVDPSGAARATLEGTKDDIPAFIGRVLEAQAVTGRKS
jgi:protein SCO1/2